MDETPRTQTSIGTLGLKLANWTASDLIKNRRDVTLRTLEDSNE